MARMSVVTEVLIVPADIDRYTPCMRRPAVSARNRAAVVDPNSALQKATLLSLIQVPFDVVVEI